MKRFCPFVFTIMLLFALMMHPVAFAIEGKLITDVVHIPALEGNLVGDATKRSIIIYLPPSYETLLEKRYPVLYLLHGGRGFTNTTWIGGGYLVGFNIKNVMDRLITNGKLHEMIIVMPDTNSKRYLGTLYTNTPVLGNYEDYLTRNLIEYVDSHYRTLPQSASRGIAGHSLGGYGAIYLAMKHPETYAAVYGHESSALEFDEYVPSYYSNFLSAVKVTNTQDMAEFQKATSNIKVRFAFPASFSPNPNNPPFFVDWPWELVGGELKRIEPIWKKWLQFEPVTMIAHLKENLLRLRAIKFDAATGGNINTARAFHQALTNTGIPHVFEEFQGGHFEQTAERVEAEILPFFSTVLALEMLPTVGLQTLCKRTITWGQIKFSE